MAMGFDTARHTPPVDKKPPLDYYVPTVYIGLGGTGKEVLMRLRKRSYDKIGHRQRDFVRYLIIDTDARQWWPRNEREEDYAPVKPQESEIVECPISEGQFYTAFDLRDREGDPRYQWLNPRMRHYKAPIDGAGTHRQFGRLAFMLNYSDIRSRVETHMTAARAAAARPKTTGQIDLAIDQNSLEIVIVTSLAGGTGAGMFIDVAYLVKHIFNTNDALRGVPSKYVSLVAVLPTPWKDQDQKNYRKFQRNGYASLLELEHYGTPRTGDELFLGRSKDSSNQQDRVGFVAPWAGGKFIEGVGWNVCYLIDNATPLTTGAPQTIVETYRMIADYLFLDLHGSQFALQKRSNRCNLGQYQQHWLEPRVRGLDAGAAAPGLVRDTDIVYAAQHGCTFSSFGLAEITCNRERVYRAVGYLLASRLISQRWLGSPKGLNDTRYQKMAKADTAPFTCDNLMLDLYKTPAEGNFLAVAKEDCRKVRERNPASGAAEIDKLITRHDAETLPGGRAYQAASDRAAQLIGSPEHLGPARDQLRRTARKRANELGMLVATELLAHHRRCFTENTETANQQTARPVTDEHIERLREGDTLWPLARGIAQGILYPRACDSGAKCVLARYKSTAAPHVVRVNKLLHDYAGAKDESVPTALTSHGTLVAWFEQANVRLGKIAAYLESQFNALRGETGDFRKRSLLPNWTIDVYLDRINRALIAYEFVGQAGTGDGFNLDALSNLVLEGLRTNRTYDLAHVRSLVELVDEWLKKQQKRDEDIARIGDMIAQQCQQIVENARLDLDALQNGSVIDMLMLEHSRQERKGMLDVMVKYSAPYFPLEMQRLAQMVDNYCPAFDNLLGCGAGEIVGVSDQNKAELIAELQDISNSQGHGLDGNLHSTLEAEKSSLILCREVWGLPLLYYASLGTVYEAYEEDIQRADEYHIDWRETSENLPDIRVIDPQVYESIRENVENVLFLMIVGIINCDAQGTYCISVDDWLGLGTDRFPLGSRLSRIIKKACEQQAIRNQMEKDRVDWEDKAAAKKWAMVYASCVLTYQHARTRVNWANTPQSFPLRNCFQILLEKVQQHLSDDQAGSLWHEFLRPKSASRDGEDAEAQFKATYQWLVDAGILCRVSPFVPIYQVDWRRLDQVELPGAGPQLQVKPPIE